MPAISEKRVNWRKVAEERGEEANTLRACVIDIRTAFREWEYDLANGADQRYQAKVHAILLAVGLPTIT